MSKPLNIFENLLVSNLVSFFKERALLNGVTAEIVPGQDDNIEVSPRIVISSSSSVEAVYQTGIYQVTVDFSSRVNLDDPGSSDINSTDSIGSLHGFTLDCLQQIDLQSELNSSGEINVQGIVLEDQSLDQVDDRRWWKSAKCSFFGYAIPPG